MRMPKYRFHKATAQAIVTFNGRDFYLGSHGSPESMLAYHNLCQQYENSGGKTPAIPKDEAVLTVGKLASEFLTRRAAVIYRGETDREYARFKVLVRILNEQCGAIPVEKFGPLALQQVRSRLVEIGNSRKYINRQVVCIKQIFRWGVSQELVSVNTLTGLESVQFLSHNETDAPDLPPREPVPLEHVRATIELCGPIIAAMARLHILSGVRPHELSREIRPVGNLRMKSGNRVSLFQCDGDRRYLPQQFAALLPKPEPKQEPRPFNPDGNTFITDYLDAQNITVRSIIEGDLGWLLQSNGKTLLSPDSQSGAPSGEYVSDSGVEKVKIRTADPPPNLSGGGRYSAEMLFVNLRFNGSWKNAAAWCAAQLDKEKPEVDFRGITDGESPKESPAAPTKQSATIPAIGELDTYIEKLFAGEGDTLYTTSPCFEGFEIGPGLITLVGAPPGTGKTAFAMQLVFDALQNDPNLTAVIANAEMGFNVLVRRELCRQTDIQDQRLRFAELTDYDRNLINNALPGVRQSASRMRLMNAPFSVPGLHQVQEECEPGIIVVDYLQKFAATGGDTRQEVNAVVGKLRQLAFAGWAVLALSATSRQQGGGHDAKKLSLASFKESGELEFNADSAYLLREGAVDGCVKEITLDCVKNRNGERQQVELLFTMNRMMFSDAATPIVDLPNDALSDPFWEVPSA